MSGCSFPTETMHVYKRRKLQNTSVALLSSQTTNILKENGNYSSSVSSLSSTSQESLHPEEVDDLKDSNKEYTSISSSPNSRKCYLCIYTISDKGSELVPRSDSIQGSVGENEKCYKTPLTDLHKADDHSGLNHVKQVVARVLSPGISSKNEPCIGLAQGDSVEVEDAIKGRLLTCKICGVIDHSLKMMICDLCEGAFHLYCNNPRVKKIPIDDWFCQKCSISKTRKREGLGPISSMFMDDKPHTTGVRIGKGFQAEVPKWSGPTLDDFDNIGESLEINPSDITCLNEWQPKISSRNSIGNWLQCQEPVNGTAENNSNEIICGKWRRAPLFAVQTADWDCSCAVLWDPFHADCAVPQELETDEVLRHLKYMELLRPRLDGKKKPNTSKNVGHKFLRRL